MAESSDGGRVQVPICCSREEAERCDAVQREKMDPTHWPRWAVAATTAHQEKHIQMFSS